MSRPLLENYFDHAATTPLDEYALAAMLPWLSSEVGNANSVHTWGRNAREAVERARMQLMTVLGTSDPSEIVFTSGATESNNWFIRSQFESGTQLAISPFEHSSLREPGLHVGAAVLRNSSWDVELNPNAVNCVIHTHNETGAIILPEELDSSLTVMSDVTQSLGKVSIPQIANLSFATGSAHKIHGPTGVGFLYARDALFPEPFLIGGGQESGARSGTLNVAGIVGFGEAAHIAREEVETRSAVIKELRSIILDEISSLPDLIINESERQNPAILSISFAGVQGETLVVACDHAGFAVSAGAACSSNSQEPSPSLVALGLPTPYERGTIRISFSHQNTNSAASGLGKVLVSEVNSLRSLTF